MAIYRGPGGPGDAVADAASEAALISTLVTQAQTAETNAGNSASAAGVSATSASNSASSAATSASNAATSATSAAASLAAIGSSEANAAASASAAATSATNAANSATSAGSSATSATASASAASSSASAASTSASNAASSASSASTSATNAASSASTASTAATNASNSATAAATSASNASTSATNAASSASSATTSANNASTSASQASTAAGQASASASNAATSETNAANSASAAATSATNASNSASSASTSANNAAASYDAFDDRYLGAKSSPPSLDNDGNALLTGALYWNTTGNQLYVWDGSAWDAAAFNTSGALFSTDIGVTVQAYDGDLNAIAALSGTSGFLKKTAANTWTLDTNTYLTSETFTGTVTSVAMTVPTGLTVSGTPITSSGTFAVSLQSGYSIPTTTSQSNWDTAYSWGNHASAGYLTSVAIGTTVQAYDAGLQSIAGLTTAADRMIYTTASDTYAVTTLTAAGRAILDDADTAAQRTTLGLVIGTNVQAYDADLAAIAALTPTADNFIVGNGTTWILETPAQARTSLGATTVGSNLFTLTNPSAIRFPRFNTDNTVSALSATDFRTAIGAGTGNGTVTGVTATSPVASSGGTAPVISLSSAYGDTLNPYGSKTANFVLAAPNGSAGAPTFRAIVAADIPTLNQNTTGTASNVTGTVAIANGGTGGTTQATARTGLGATTVGANLFTLTDPGAITFPRFNADNTVSSLNAADFRTAIGAGTSSTTGTVTSITAGTGLSGGTITTSGTIALANTAVSAGSYTNASITVDAQGRITSASSGTSSGITMGKAIAAAIVFG